MFMSFGGLKKLNWLFAPRLPYRASKKSIFKKGYSNIVEVPLSASFIPYVGTTLRIFPWISKYQRKILSLESSLIGKPIVFDVKTVVPTEADCNPALCPDDTSVLFIGNITIRAFS